MNESSSERPPTVPSATYRLQFTPQFGFRDATRIVPYLHDLGVGHMYASPYLKARPGSMHGYDVVDPNLLNPEVGTPAEHAAMVAAAQDRGMGQILDFVPNHMGVGSNNPWWIDVLEWGEASPYAGFFDIDWHPLKPELQGKVLVPTLGDHYGRVLESGDVTLRFDAQSGRLSVGYFENWYPLALASYAEIVRRAEGYDAPEMGPLAARFAAYASDAQSGRADLAAVFERAQNDRAELARLAQQRRPGAALERALNDYAVDPDDARSADLLDTLLQHQHYRLAYWRVAVDEVNYRRFFDINDLAGLRVEDADVLGQTHRLAFELIAAGQLQGLRIDHVDGLYNPGGYCNLLKERADALGQPLYVVVEKILALPFERVRAGWLIAGTTGYEFANLVNGLFVDARAEAGFTRIYARAIGRDSDYDAIAYESKRRIMSVTLASELTVLATSLSRIAASDRRSSDFTYNGLRDALMDVIACFPVYRTYVLSEQIEVEDQQYIERAVGAARRRSSLPDESVFAFIADVLTLRAAGPDTNYDRNAVLRFAMRFQQYTSPVMAKSIEDTVFYRYVRLISLNEVGGDPTRFGTLVDEFHATNVERAATRPHTMLATSTHDHKRGEDVRTRIDALTENPAGWSRALQRWSRVNRTKRTALDNTTAPDPNAEYLLYQTLVGTWPSHWSDAAAIADGEYADYVDRITAYMQKAQREAKVRTSWSNPDQEYEAASEAFIRAILARSDEARFPGELASFVADLAPGAMVSSIAQLVLKCTAPGVPDIYQGCELWDHSLVDPDNRRPVDYLLRAAMLADAKADPAAARASWFDGRVKLFVTWKLLSLRAQRRATFLDGPYTPLPIVNGPPDRVVAFMRSDIVVIAPRLIRGIVRLAENGPRLDYGDETVELPPNAASRYADLFTDGVIEVRGGRVAVAQALGAFPVSVLVPA